MLAVNRLSVTLGNRKILQDITFGLSAGETTAIVGANGCGKTTLLNCIRGVFDRFEGSITRKKNLRIAHLSQETAYEKMTVIEFLLSSSADIAALYRRLQRPHPAPEVYSAYYATGGYDLERRCERLACQFGFDAGALSRDIGAFSEGQKQLWAIIRLLLFDGELLLLDEPTNHLDIEMLIYLEQALTREKNRGKSLLVVSHDRLFIDRIADKTLLIKNGENTLVHGGYTALLEHTERDFRSRMGQASILEKRIRRLELQATARKVHSGRREHSSRDEKAKQGQYNRGFTGARAARLAKKAKAAERRRDRAVEELKAKRPFIEKKQQVKFPEYSVAPRTVVTASSVAKSFDDRLVLNGIAISLKTTGRSALIGANGSGKTTLMRCLIGDLWPSGGEIRRNEAVSQLYIPQVTRDFYRHRSFLDNFLSDGQEESLVRQYLGAVGLRGDRVLQSVDSLSPGELMRGAIVRAVLARTEFLFLDEPTNHLDIESIESLESLLDGFPGGLFFISHDRRFISRNAETIYILENGHVRMTAL
jgi:ATP-binding cassette subfamily F protein 3